MSGGTYPITHRTKRGITIQNFYTQCNLARDGLGSGIYADELGLRLS